MPLHEYQVVGRHVPTATDLHPKIYRMRLFTKSAIIAKSRFWYYLSQRKKMKRASGEILSVNEIFERRPNIIKNFGIFVRYLSRTGDHNIYKEYRDVSRTGAVTQLYQELAGSYRARFRSIHVISVEEVSASKCRRPNIKQFHADNIKFPLPHRVLKAPNKSMRTTFKAVRPNTHLS